MTFRISSIKRQSRFSSRSQNRFQSVAASVNTTGVSESAVTEAANAAANTLKKDLPEGIKGLAHAFDKSTSYSSNTSSNGMKAAVMGAVMSYSDQAGNQESFGPGGTEAAINKALFGNQVDETKASGSSRSDTGGNLFGFSQETKDTLKSTGENLSYAAGAVGAGGAMYAASSTAALAAATGGTGLVAVVGVAGAVTLAGIALAVLGKYGEWHPDQLTGSGRTGFDPVTGKFDPSKGLGSLPNEIYGGIQASKAGTILMTAQEASLVMKAVEAGSGGHVTNPVGDSASSINALNMMNAEFQLSGGGVVDPHLLRSALSNIEVLA